uniref:Uncharacterized protein n=1 Tax=Arundo donax TaxID=35708 RepID=A0A0A8Y6L1_ARUDO
MIYNLHIQILVIESATD